MKFSVADARNLPFVKEKFDVLLCLETLEHIPNNHLVVMEFKRVLKKGGILIVLQDTDSWFFNLIWFFWTKWKGKVWEVSHISCMKPRELKQFLVSGGFKIIEKRITHFGLEVSFKAKKK